MKLLTERQQMDKIDKFFKVKPSSKKNTQEVDDGFGHQHVRSICVQIVQKYLENKASF